MYATIDSSQDLFLQQCIQKSELNWVELAVEWNNFPYSQSFLSDLVCSSHAPMKILASISPRSLWALLEHIYEDRLVRVILEQVRGHSNLTWLVPGVQVVLAALKWSLVSSGLAKQGEILLTPADLKALIDSHITIAVTESNKDFA